MKETATTSSPVVERIQQDLNSLATYRDDSRPGWTREVFSESYHASREWTKRLMREAGLDVFQDDAGNLVGRMQGRDPNAAPIITGSHTDTVDGGGRFDGIVGVLGAVEAVRNIRESGLRLHRDLIVVDFLGEESNEFGLSCLGSRALAGELTPGDMNRVGTRGNTLGQAYEHFGLEPSAALGKPWIRGTKPHAYIELHVEQGNALEQAGLGVGIVSAISGIDRLLARFVGKQDHAGTRAMAERHDAMVAAASAVLALRAEGCGAPTHGVATTTSVTNQSHSPNVVPGLVELRGEVRSTDRQWLSGTRKRLAEQIGNAAKELGVEADLSWTTDNEIVEASRGVQDIAAAVVDAMGIPWMAVPSGATHDAVHMARLAPMGMIFVPSKDGKSHCPEEWTDPAAIGLGVEVLTRTLRQLDVTATFN
ncbi:M20 family metallo-hydrolase [Paenarthrobacter sp. YJN-5]|uniref:M20 family metallo-hydrolase n=1 Tax=Paenarthrobacter sp. YJN-5 TaxID=2735316 RepID=UPI001877BDED|nr:M20 family metallo-hydrolase [Paenarthrobacter sp. YJN-5]QOT19838.1 M20 family metallo-hydrolase [Paenarthrobacter sp. YJN-5]